MIPLSTVLVILLYSAHFWSTNFLEILLNSTSGNQPKYMTKWYMTNTSSILYFKVLHYLFQTSRRSLSIFKPLTWLIHPNALTDNFPRLNSPTSTMLSSTLFFPLGIHFPPFSLSNSHLSFKTYFILPSLIFPDHFSLAQCFPLPFIFYNICGLLIITYFLVSPTASLNCH